MTEQPRNPTTNVIKEPYRITISLKGKLFQEFLKLRKELTDKALAEGRKLPTENEVLATLYNQLLPKEKVEDPKKPEKAKERYRKSFKTEDEFREWLRKQGIKATPRPYTQLYKNEKQVGIYFETAEGFEVELGEDAETWLIRDETYLKVEPANEEVTLEQPLETPIKKEEESS